MILEKLPILPSFQLLFEFLRSSADFYCNYTDLIFFPFLFYLFTLQTLSSWISNQSSLSFLCALSLSSSSNILLQFLAGRRMHRQGWRRLSTVIQTKKVIVAICDGSVCVLFVVSVESVGFKRKRLVIITSMELFLIGLLHI